MAKYLLTIAALLLLIACTRQVATTTRKIVTYDQQEELAPGQYLSLGKAGPVFTFVEVISDSRCPRGVDCIRAGEAVVRLEVAGNVREYVIPAKAENKELVRFAAPGG
ncbi:MAG: hypothetical protein AAFZ52_18485, partial [Bacteroidota bacterium]